MIDPIIGDWTPLRTEKKRKITPHQAKKILELCNEHNRPIPNATVTRIKIALQNDTWKYNGEPIIFAYNGMLLDGQGRLTACVESGIPLITDIAFGHDPEVFDSLDRNKIRDESDDLALIGEKHVKQLSATLKLICAYLDGHRGYGLLTIPYRFHQMKKVLDQNPDIRNSVHFAVVHQRKILCPPRIVAMVHFFAGQNAQFKITIKRNEFFDRLADGTNLTIGNPVHTLREKFLSMDHNPDARVKKGMGNISTMTYMHSLVKTWNAYLLGRKLTKIQLTYSDPEKSNLIDLPNIKNEY